MRPLITWLADRFFQGDRMSVLAMLFILSIIPSLLIAEAGLNRALPDSCDNPACGLDGPELRATLEAYGTPEPTDPRDIIEDVEQGR